MYQEFLGFGFKEKSGSERQATRVSTSFMCVLSAV